MTPPSPLPIELTDFYCHPMTGECIIPQDKLIEVGRRLQLYPKLVDALDEVDRFGVDDSRLRYRIRELLHEARGGSK